MTRLVKTKENINGLPIGFTEVEYLQSTGTQYIDIGLKGKNNLDFEYKCEFTNLDGTAQCVGGNWSGQSSSNVSMYFGLIRANGNFAYHYDGTSSPVVVMNTTVQGTPYSIQGHLWKGEQYFVINGTKSSVGTITSEFTSPLNMYLFGINNNGLANPGYIKLHYFKLWDNSTLVRNFIPALNPAGRPCMYDLVEKKSYYNLGTGEFTYGRKIIPVEYLETINQQNNQTSATDVSWIDTGIIPNDNTKLECRMAFTTLISGNSNEALCGSTGDGANTRLAWGFASLSPYTNFYFGLGGQNLTTSVTRDTNVHTFKIDAVNKTWAIDNTSGSFTSSGSLSGTRSIFLFARHNAGYGDNVANKPANAKIYYCKIWNSNTIVRDYIPCIDENNVGFMFDRVTHTCLLNKGTGTFSYGNPIYTTKTRLIKYGYTKDRLPIGFKRVEYLQSSGTEWINTGVTINTATDEVEMYFQLMSTTLYQWLMGEHDNGARFGVGVGDGTNKRNIAYGASTYKVNDTQVYNSIHKFVANSNGVYLDGVQVHAFESFSSTSIIYLFNLNINGAGNGASGKIWRYTHKRNGVLIRDFIPALDTTNTPCMYDMVSKTPYYNQGTGTFTAGRQIIPVEYLGSTGAQYIDTGYTSNNIYTNSACEVICETSDLSNRIAGCGGLSDNNKNISLTFSGGGYILGLYGDKWTSNIFPYSTNTKYKIKFEVSTSQQKLYVNDNLVETTTYSWNSSNNYPLRLFKTNADTYTKPTKISSFKLWISNSLVRDFIPCKDENGVGFMFDKITNAIYDNAGSGVFTTGNIILSEKTRLIPSWLDDYTFVNYIQSTGTQYINTGVTLTNNHSVEIDYQLTQASQSRAGLFGNLNMTGSNQGRFGSILSPSNQQLEHGYGTGNNYWQQGLPNTNRHKLYQKKNEIYFDGTLIHTFTSATFTLNTTALLGNFVYTNYTPAKAKYYNSKWWNGDTLIRNFIPAIRKSDSAVGMLDIVNRVFYTNQGTGVFSYG